VIQNFETTTISLCDIKVPRSNRSTYAATRKMMEAVDRDGQQRPLIIDSNNLLLSDIASFYALKGRGYDFVEVIKLTIPSPASVRAINRLLDRCKPVRRAMADFNAAWASLYSMLEIEAEGAGFDLCLIVKANTGEMSIRLQPAAASDEGAQNPLDI
jgi:hypothetical protein